MLTEHDETTVATIGSRLRAAFLIQQVQYTLEVANADGPALWALLPDGYEREVHDMMRSVERRLKEKTFAEEESKLATVAQNDWMAQGKVWRRKVVARAQRATRMGKDMPEKLVRIGRAWNVQALLVQMIDMVHLLEQYAADIPGGVRDLVTGGRDIVAQLSTADAKQEAARLAELPQVVRAYQADKGRLYMAIKAINDTGRELHAHDSLKAARYNLSILHRRPARSKSDVNPAVPEVASTEAS